MKTPADELLAEPIRRALWTMKWTALRPLQTQSIFAVLRSSTDLILSARTAAGKTEAAFLPILSQICDAPVGSIRAIYVGPLKALINDQFRRLEDLCSFAEIPVHRWHGDVSADKKRKLVDRPGGVLLITPESLESLLINRSHALGRILHSLSYIVIDELHALLGKERGVQLRSQLYRVADYTITPPRIVALSATLGDLSAAAKWISPDFPESVQILTEPNQQKDVQYLINGYTNVRLPAKSGEDQDLVAPPAFHRDLYDHFRGKKNLIFANAKSVVEEVTDALNDIGRKLSTGEEFLIHHGSLSKEVREETESLMQGDRPFTTVCSSTLELGIDIGNVHTVGQIGPCWSVSSLVQRLGRSGRKDGEPHRMRVFVLDDPIDPKSPLEQRLHLGLLQCVALTELMLRRWIESPNPDPFDLSTLVQQCLSVIAETGGILASKLFDRLIAKGAFRFLDQRRFAAFLRTLATNDLIEQHPDGTLILGLAGETLVRHYDFYAAFKAPPEFRVVHDGRMIGRLSADNLPRPDDHILLAGRRWQVIAVEIQREEILVKRAKGRKVPIFPPSEGDIAHEIRREMRGVLQGSDAPRYLDEQAKTLLADARLEAAQAGLIDWDVISQTSSNLIWFPWTGSASMRTLALLFEWASIPAELRSLQVAFDIDPSSSNLRSDIDKILQSPPTALELSANASDVERRKWDHFVSAELLVESFASDCIDLPNALTCLESFRDSLVM